MDNIVVNITELSEAVTANITEANDIVQATVNQTTEDVSVSVTDTIQQITASIAQTNEIVTVNISEAASTETLNNVLLELKMTTVLGRYKEFTYNISGDISKLEIYRDNTKAIKDFTINYTYTGSDITLIDVVRESDGYNYKKTLTYSGGNLSTINIEVV